MNKLRLHFVIFKSKHGTHYVIQTIRKKKKHWRFLVVILYSYGCQKPFKIFQKRDWKKQHTKNNPNFFYFSKKQQIKRYITVWHHCTHKREREWDRKDYGLQLPIQQKIFKWKHTRSTMENWQMQVKTCNDMVWKVLAWIIEWYPIWTGLVVWIDINTISNTPKIVTNFLKMNGLRKRGTGVVNLTSLKTSNKWNTTSKVLKFMW